MDFLAQHIYLTGVILFGLCWLLVFLKTKQSKEMLVMGTLFGFGAIFIGQFYALHDYWNPVYVFGHTFPVEDFFYGFFYGGALASVYDLFDKPIEYRNEHPHYGYALFGLIITIGSFIVLVDLLSFNSIIAHIVPPVLVGTLILVTHRFLLIPMFTTMLLGTLLTFVIFQILLLIDPLAVDKIWMLGNLSGIQMLGIPIEEYLFAAALGFSTPFFYETVKGHIPKY